MKIILQGSPSPAQMAAPKARKTEGCRRSSRREESFFSPCVGGPSGDQRATALGEGSAAVPGKIFVPGAEISQSFFLIAGFEVSGCVPGLPPAAEYADLLGWPRVCRCLVINTVDDVVQRCRCLNSAGLGGPRPKKRQWRPRPLNNNISTKIKIRYLTNVSLSPQYAKRNSIRKTGRAGKIPRPGPSRLGRGGLLVEP